MNYLGNLTGYIYSKLWESPAAETPKTEVTQASADARDERFVIVKKPDAENTIPQKPVDKVVNPASSLTDKQKRHQEHQRLAQLLYADPYKNSAKQSETVASERPRQGKRR